MFWLDSRQFPYAYYRTVGAAALEANTANFQGELTLMGVTRPVALQVVFNGGALNVLSGKYTIGFEATGSFKRSDFGLKNYIPAVGDEVEIEIYGEFQRN